MITNNYSGILKHINTTLNKYLFQKLSLIRIGTAILLNIYLNIKTLQKFLASNSFIDLTATAHISDANETQIF